MDAVEGGRDLRSAKLCFFRLPQAPAMIHPPVSAADIAARCSRGWFSHGDTRPRPFDVRTASIAGKTDVRGTWLSAAKQRSGKAFPKAKSSSCSCQHTASRRSNRKTSGDVFLAECTATNKFCMSAGSLVLTLETFQHSRRSRCKPRAMWVRAVPLDFKVCVPSRPKDNPPMGGHRSGSPKWTSCNPLAGDVPRAPPPHPRAGWSRRCPIPRALDEISPSSGRRLNTNAASGAEI